MISRLKYLVFSALVAGPAAALPSIEEYADLVSVSDGRKTVNDLVFGDHVDPDLVYVPFDRVELLTEDGRPAFGLTYNTEGGMLNFSVRATYSEARKRLIQRLASDGKRVKPLAPTSGGWSLSVFGAERAISLGIGTNSDGQSINTILPDVPVAFSMFLPKAAVAYVVNAFKTGANVALKYQYTFRGVLTPFTVRASVNWQNFSNFVQNETLVDTEGCTAEGSESFWPNFLGGGSSQNKSCLNTHTDIRDVVRTAIQRQHIKIHSLSSGRDGDQRMLDEITKLILSRQFKPRQSFWKPIDLPQTPVTCDVGGDGNFESSCFGMTSSYVWNREWTWEEVEQTFEITSQEVAYLPGAVGGHLNVMCERHPELFLNVDTDAQGCPTRWDARTGISTPQNGGPPVAPVNPNNDRAIDEILIHGVGL
jgi:hypothetical protein